MIPYAKTVPRLTSLKNLHNLYVPALNLLIVPINRRSNDFKRILLQEFATAFLLLFEKFEGIVAHLRYAWVFVFANLPSRK